MHTNEKKSWHFSFCCAQISQFFCSFTVLSLLNRNMRIKIKLFSYEKNASNKVSLYTASLFSRTKRTSMNFCSNRITMKWNFFSGKSQTMNIRHNKLRSIEVNEKKKRLLRIFSCIFYARFIPPKLCKNLTYWSLSGRAMKNH